jgi:eukaryotic-like serine/threonine-protein kinase
MTQFSQLSDKEYASIYLEDTDHPLPKKIDPRLRYAFFSTITKGGKSLIKSCKDMHLSRFICYKTLRPEFKDDPVEQLRLLREARISAMLQHPNTVPTYEIGRDTQGNIYFTMKLIHGYTLREIFDYRERYDLVQLLEVIMQIAQALEYAHSHGVIHRDIKPENILIGPFGEVLLLDWGLAKVWRKDGSSTQLDNSTALSKNHSGSDLSITRLGKLQGTVSYMSPEQIDRDPEIDERTDVYSLGAILYEVLAGTTAAQGKTVDQIIASTLNQEAVRPSTIVSSPIPAMLENIVMKCIQKKPEDRIQTARELIRLLQEDWQLS